MYEQLDVVSMGGSLGLILTNIIMTNCEKVIADKFIEDSIMKLYVKYVDDTLLVIKRSFIAYILNKFNSFDNL